MTIAWATDPHFNFVDESYARAFCEQIRETEAEALLLGGDIAEAPTLGRWLKFLEQHLSPLPVYFVLGNHDYYHSDIASVRENVSTLQSSAVQWLPGAGVIALTQKTALVGHDGWGDAHLGDFMNSQVIFSDYILIRDLREVAGPQMDHTGRPNLMAGWENKSLLKNKLGALGDNAAHTLRPLLTDALEQYPHVIVLTHVPPFRESCRYNGKISGDAWLPGMSCKAVGDMLMGVASIYEDRSIMVLCGHTHGAAETRPLPNLFVRTGDAEYGTLRFHLVEVEE